eukprot:1029163-Alexandrium_andersonii.AAC.1
MFSRRQWPFKSKPRKANVQNRPRRSSYQDRCPCGRASRSHATDAPSLRGDAAASAAKGSSGDEMAP